MPEQKSDHQKLFEQTVKKLATTPKEAVAQKPSEPNGSSKA
jgi:hypothetical protein